MHAWFTGFIARNIVLSGAVSYMVELDEASAYILQLPSPNPNPVYGHEAVPERRRLWLQLDKHLLRSVEGPVYCGLGGRHFYHARRLLSSALLVASAFESCLPELPKGLLGGGG